MVLRLVPAASGAAPGEKGGAGPAATILLAILLALAIGAASIPRNWVQDDAYITFRYARNLAQGQGLVFNPGERVFGCTTPLYALLLAGPARLGIPMELTSRLIAGFSLAALILALFCFSRSALADPWPGLLASVFLITNPVLLYTGLSGMESNLFLALWAWTFAALAKGKPGWAVWLAGLSLWCRIEGGVVLAVAVGFLLLDPASRKSWRRWLPGLVLAALYPLLAWIYYGTPWPQSFTAKLARSATGLAGALELSRQFARVFVGRSYSWFGLQTAFGVLIPFTLAGLARIVRSRPKKWAPLLVSLSVYALAYILSGRLYARNFPWYFLPPLPGLYLAAAVGTLFIFGLLIRRFHWRESRPALLPLLLALLWAGITLPILLEHAELCSIHVYARERVYAAAALWADQTLPAGEMLAANEVGTVGYYSHRRILDLFGVVATEKETGNQAQKVRNFRPALLLLKDHFPDQGLIAKALPQAYRWQKWRRLWIGVRADLSLEVSKPELERHYAELPR